MISKRSFRRALGYGCLVSAIGGVLAAISVPNFKAARERSGTRAMLASAKTLISAMEMYNLDKNTRRTTLDGNFMQSLKSGGYLQSVPTDPGDAGGSSEKTVRLAIAMMNDPNFMYAASQPPPPPEASVPPSPPALGNIPGTESYAEIVEHDAVRVSAEPLSTFSIDVDTASYSNVRRFIQNNQRPPRDAVRIEEFVNYFPYDDAPPVRGDVPFAVHPEVTRSPWDPNHRLVRIGIKGKVLEEKDRRPSNLVFLVDVSGSMDSEERLPLVIRSLKLLTDNLRENDRVAIVVYAGSSGLVLPSTSGDSKQAIRNVLGNLHAGGSTNGSGGIQQAYAVAQQNFIQNGVNRVILCTDGDFNVGVSGVSELAQLAEQKAKTGVFLTVLGYGMGNYKDDNLERLADRGNGNYAFIDSEAEARKVLVDQLTGTLVTIAKDVKIQVEFNPDQVEAYRLIGYENRRLAAADFNNDRKDAGELGAGHSVTALYDIVPKGGHVSASGVDPLKYQTATAPTGSAELLTVKLRYKAPDGYISRLIEVPLTDRGAEFEEGSASLRFGAAVASFGMLLRGSKHAGGMTCVRIQEIASGALGRDPHGYRKEFVELVARSKLLALP